VWVRYILYATITPRYAFVPERNDSVKCRATKPLALSNLPVHYTGTNRSGGVPSVKRSTSNRNSYHPVHWNKLTYRQNTPKIKIKRVQKHCTICILTYDWCWLYLSWKRNSWLVNQNLSLVIQARTCKISINIWAPNGNTVISLKLQPMQF
jgi:hypothetical protein